jgi:isoquinoline 1-oxidoreductase subunit beta
MSMIQWRISRRGLLIGSSALGALALGSCAAIKPSIPTLVDFGEKSSFNPKYSGSTDPLVWFELDPAGVLTLFVPKAEMGQGVLTVIAQLAAEELEIQVDQLTVRQISSMHQLNGLSGTFGSRSVRASYYMVRQAAATLREMLRAEAATQFGVQPTSVNCQAGRCVSVADANRTMSYGQIVSVKKTPWQLPESKPKLKERKEFTLIGTSVKRVDTLEKITGKTPYGIQARLDNLTYGAMYLPSRQGARITKVDSVKASAFSGVLAVVVDLEAQFVGVVAINRTIALRAVALLIVTVEGGEKTNQDQLETAVTAKPATGLLVRKRGDLAGNPSEFQITGNYRTPLAAHAHLEPLCATVSVTKDKIQAWVSTQDVNFEKEHLEEFWGSRFKINVEPMPMGGSFGRKGFQSTVVPASILSNAVQRPVALAWTREQEMRNSFYRHPTHSVFRGACNSNGKISAIEQSLCSGTNAILKSSWILETLQKSLEVDGSMFTGLFSQYAIPNYRAYIRSVPIPVHTGIWRGVALVPNQFAFESFIDELAQDAKIDPIAFRQNNLLNTQQGERIRGVLDGVRKLSGWDLPAPYGYSRGVACSFFSNTAVAVVIESKVINGAITIGRVFASIDAGLIVNPAGAKLQALGSILMGLSSALYEKITLKNGIIEQSNFDDYGILRLSETPQEIEIQFIDSPLDPQGLGEPVIGPVAPALANALSRATGKRLRELPLVI